MIFIFWLLIPLVLTADHDYKKLVEYAKLNSLAYCVKYGLKLGVLTDKSNCFLSYCHDFKLLDIKKVFNFNDLGDIGSGYYGIDHESSRIILAFRGTSSRRDWFANIDAILIQYEPLINLVEGREKIKCVDCKVHKGFYNFLKKNLSDILSAVAAFKSTYPDYQVVILGHSLGASLALLSGIEFQLMGFKPLLITYAGPKIGNEPLLEFIDKLFNTKSVLLNIYQNHDFENGFIRVVHQNDLVPKLPPTSLFTHAGVEYIINKKFLPHKPENLERIVESNYENQLVKGPSMPQWFNKYEHNHYFIKITDCKGQNK